MRRYLVVADETVGGRLLLDEISARHAAGPSRFDVLVPARVPKEGLTWTESDARGLARDRLDRTLNRFRELGVEAVGGVADPDPFLAIQDAFREERFDEIILSAPSKRAGWMKPDLPGKVTQAFGVPVTYVPGELERAARETALMRSSLFGGLPKRHLSALAKMSMVENYREGTTIVEGGSVGSDLFVILDGRVKVIADDLTVDHLFVGETFGETSLLAPGPRTATVTAEAPTRCLVLSGEDLREAISRDAQLAAKVLQAAGERLRDLSRNLSDVMQSLILDARVLEELAEAAHIEYCAEELGKGMTWGEPTDEYLLRHERLSPFAGHERDPARTGRNLVAYGELPEEVKEQDRDLARDIPDKLAAAGYVMRPLRGKSPARFSEGEVELLAEREHDRWVRLKLAQGWSFAASRSDEARRHPDLVPWGEITSEERVRRYGTEGESRVGPGVLSENEKEKNRALIRRVGSILARTGYTGANVSGTVG